MARAALKLADNAAGDWFVDETCIDCDLCRQIAPETFVRSARAGQSVVGRQPATAEDERRAAMALVACPTASIGSLRKPDAVAAARAFPERIEGEVYFCGFASPDSYGASSYLIRRPSGNVLVDSPRAARPLLARLAEAGGVDLLFLSHRDDVADHAVFRERFGCRRVLHRADRTADTASIEQFLDGREPVRLADDLLAIPVPGHTRGSTALLYGDTFLFTGDHLWWDDDAPAGLDASRSVCWYSWPEQVRSVERLLDFRFEWVLPGHGRRFRARDAAHMRDELAKLLRRIR